MTRTATTTRPPKTCSPTPTTSWLRGTRSPPSRSGSGASPCSNASTSGSKPGCVAGASPCRNTACNADGSIVEDGRSRRSAQNAPLDRPGCRLFVRAVTGRHGHAAPSCSPAPSSVLPRSQRCHPAGVDVEVVVSVVGDASAGATVTGSVGCGVARVVVGGTVGRAQRQSSSARIVVVVGMVVATVVVGSTVVSGAGGSSGWRPGRRRGRRVGVADGDTDRRLDRTDDDVARVGVGVDGVVARRRRRASAGSRRGSRPRA